MDAAVIIGLITGIVTLLGSVIGVAIVCSEYFKGKGPQNIEAGEQSKCSKYDGHQNVEARAQPGTTFTACTLQNVTINNIWQSVSREEGPRTICIHVTPGVDLTPIAVAIKNRALRESELFDCVIWVDVSNGAGLQRVQEDIARSVSVNLPPDSNINTRAGLLRTALTGKNRFLLILDSMWRGYSPSEIGIPELTGGRKLIVTSRIRSVLNSFREREIYEIKPLTNDDAWTLFEHELGANNLSKLSSEILITRTKNAIQDLQGLSLAIKNLAQTLKNICQQNPGTPIDAEWEEVLDCLSRSATFLENRNHELFSSLRNSYQNLRAETQPCFLFCALYPKAHHIETTELIDYWMWEGLLGSGTLTDMRSNGRQRLKELLDAGLLENASEVGEEEKVKMLNLIRDMALAVAGEQLFVRAGDTFPLASAWPEAVVWASFIRNQLRALKLRGSYSFNSISTLLLQDNPFDMNHDSDFFNGMSNLKILDLSRTNISSLPNSLSNLTNLRALLLRNCTRLNDFPSLSNLKRLNVLDFSGTQLEQWPKGMQMLKNLRRLDLTQGKLDMFPASCVRNYRQLEELFMMGDINSRGCVWGSNKLRDWDGACVEWLPDLGHLVVLELVFLNASVFKSYMKACPKSTDQHPHPATCFKFFVGGFHSVGVDSNLYENSITVIGDGSIVLPQGTLVLNLMKCRDDVTSLKMAGCLRDLTVLDVFEFHELTYLLTLDMLHSLGNLRKICVRRCKNMVGIIQPAQEAKGTVISHSSLAELVLFDLKCLDSVCDGQVLNCKRLTRIEVWRCQLLRLPKLVGTGPIEIKGEKEWWDAFQQRNPGIFEGYPIRFKEAPVPPEVSSSPRVTSLDRRTPNYPIIISNHPPVLHQSAGIVDGAAESKLLRNVEKAIGKTAPDKVVDVAKTFIRLSDSVSRLPCPADRGIQEKLDLPVPKKYKEEKLDLLPYRRQLIEVR